jgi:hypothetical protein
VFGLAAGQHPRPSPTESFTMNDKESSYIREMCRRLAQIEQDTVVRLGEGKGCLFLNIYIDGLAINRAILDNYPDEERTNLVLLTFWGLFKELSWFQFFFLAGNYPLLLSRLRHVWEPVFRAYFAESQGLIASASLGESPGPSVDDKVAWLHRHGHQLRWDNCIKPALCQLFSSAEREDQVQQHYYDRWKTLRQYAHPSAYLMDRLFGPSDLHAIDNFDVEWALETIDVATDVFDLAWLTVLRMFPKAADRLPREALSVAYPVLKSVLGPGREE